MFLASLPAECHQDSAIVWKFCSSEGPFLIMNLYVNVSLIYEAFVCGWLWSISTCSVHWLMRGDMSPGHLLPRAAHVI